MRADRQPAQQVLGADFRGQEGPRRAVEGGQEQRPPGLQQPGERATKAAGSGTCSITSSAVTTGKRSALGQQILGDAGAVGRAAGPAPRRARAPPRSPRRRRPCRARRSRAGPAPRRPGRRRSRHPAERSLRPRRITGADACDDPADRAPGSSGAAAASVRPGPTSAPPGRRTARPPRRDATACSLHGCPLLSAAPVCLPTQRQLTQPLTADRRQWPAS